MELQEKQTKLTKIRKERALKTNDMEGSETRKMDGRDDSQN